MMYRKWLFELTYFVHLLCQHRFYITQVMDALADYIDRNTEVVMGIDKDVEKLKEKVALMEQVLCVMLEKEKKGV